MLVANGWRVWLVADF